MALSLSVKVKRGWEKGDWTEFAVICLALRFARCPCQALRQPTRHSCAHASHGVSPGEFGKLSKMGPRSAGPTRGAHSACACHAARSKVQVMGPRNLS